MPFTLPEALSDLPPLLELVQLIQSKVEQMPATDRTASSYSDVIVAVIPAVAKLIDTIEAQAKS